MLREAVITDSVQLVMNNFTTPATASTDSSAVPKHLESLSTTIFQSLFPPISPQNTPLSSIRRVLLLNRETSKRAEGGSYVLNLRHYAITTKSVGLSRPVRRLNNADKLISSREKKGKGLPNLGKLDDVADFLLDPSAAGYTSASETELDTDAEVEVLGTTTRKVLSNKQKQKASRVAEMEKREGRTSDVEKRAVKLVELGPRMKLRMIKVEEGVGEGKVMWHEYMFKSKEEVKEMDDIWDTRRKEKEERKRVQKENLEKKRKARGLGANDVAENEDEDDENEVEEWDSEGLAGDGEMQMNERAEDAGEWEDMEDEIADSYMSKT
jgi:ribosome biogenesis protein SSF1/2